MKTTKFLPFCALGALIATFSLAPCALVKAAPLATAFTYQGRLNDGGNPAQGIYDLRFTIYDALADGTTVGGPLTNAAVQVNNGLFTVTLDFGSGLFTGEARWLAIGVRTNSSAGDFTPLTPRQPLTPTPYALYAPSAATAGAVSGSVPAGQISGRLTDGQLSTNVALLDSSPTFSGNVGVGTTSLQARLEVAGNPRVDNTEGPQLRLTGGGSGGALSMLDLATYDPGSNAPSARIQAKDNAWSSDVDILTKIPGANENPLVSRLHIAASGDVGIGTTTPMARLEVSTTGEPLWGTAASRGLRVNAGSLSNAAGEELALASFGFRTPLNNSSFGVRARRLETGEGWDSTAIGLGMDVDETVRAGASLWLHPNGNVGIGTATPAAKLDVAGTVKAGALDVGGVPVSASGSTLTVSGQPILSGLVQASNLSSGAVVLKLNGLTDNVTLAAGTNVTLATEGNTLRISATPGSVVTNAGWGLSGNAGTTGDNFLGTTDGQALQLRVNNQVRMHLEQSGNVGIGTTTPGARLDVASGAGRQLSAGTWVDVSGSANGVGLLGGNMYQDFWPPAFKYATTHDGIGAVGFAANYPWNQASVIASGTSSSTAGAEFTPQVIATFTAGGNVGIGTPSPSAKLEVQGGAIKATGGFILELRTSDPPSPVTGQIWLRTDL